MSARMAQGENDSVKTAPGPPPGPPPKPPTKRLASFDGVQNNKVANEKLKPPPTFPKGPIPVPPPNWTALDEEDGITPDMDDKSIQKAFRKKSLLIHPDKVGDHYRERAQEAFQLMKQALDHLFDAERRQALNEISRSGRSLALQELNLPFTWSDEQVQKEQEPGGRLHGLKPTFPERIVHCTNHLMREDELYRRNRIRIKQEAEEEARKLREEAEEQRKRKAELETAWENARDNRVEGWRSFQKTKKKKKKLDVLG